MPAQTETRRLVGLFTLCSTVPEVAPLVDDIAFFDAVRAQLAKIEGQDRRTGNPGSAAEVAVRQIVSEATAAAGFIDIYAQAGLDRPDISVIDQTFIDAFPRNPNKSLAIEAVCRLLSNQVTQISERKIVKGRRFSEMLERAILAYQNRTLDSAQVMAELVELAQDIQKGHNRGIALGLDDDQLAFYDAVASNPSALELGDDTLKEIARDLLVIVRRDAKTDWNYKEHVRAKLRITIKRLLRKHGYPPDKTAVATQLVLQQAEVIAGLDEGLVGDRDSLGLCECWGYGGWRSVVVPDSR